MNRPEPVEEEFFFNEGVIISETDLEGVITYANRKFAQISGYSQAELKGQPHSILRHPDMPAEAFKDMWKTIERDEEWSGLVKNLRKDGKYYWVMSYIKPVYDKQNRKKGYIAARKIPHRAEVIRAIHQYNKLKELEG